MSFSVLKNIKLNLLRPELTVVHGKQYDNEARVIEAQLYEDNVKWYAPANTLGVISYIKPDGNYGFYDETDLGNPAVVFDANDRSKVTLVLSTQSLTCAGKVKVEVNFYDQQQAERLSSFAFTLDVEASTITQDDLTSSSEFRILAEQITEVLTAAANLSGLEADATTLAAGSAASAVVTGGTGGNPYHIQFGIPQGIQGEQGATGYHVGSVVKKSGTGTAGTTDVYGMRLNDPNQTEVGTFNVYQGADGQGAPSSTTPKMDGTATAGVENGYARGDHVHPRDTGILDLVYPVGSIYLSVNSTDPSTLFGGTWEQIQDRFLLAAGTDYSAGATGGSAEHTISVDQMPSHRHAVAKQYLHRLDSADDNFANFGDGGNLNGWDLAVASRNNAGVTRLGIQEHFTEQTGSGQSINHMPPYLAVYMWKRTA